MVTVALIGYFIWMSPSEKLQMLFEAAMMEAEQAAPPRMAAIPHNPNGSKSHLTDGGSNGHEVEQFDPRREMLARVNRMKEMLTKA